MPGGGIGRFARKKNGGLSPSNNGSGAKNDPTNNPPEANSKLAFDSSTKENNNSNNERNNVEAVDLLTTNNMSMVPCFDSRPNTSHGFNPEYSTNDFDFSTMGLDGVNDCINSNFSDAGYFETSNDFTSPFMNRQNLNGHFEPNVNEADNDKKVNECDGNHNTSKASTPMHVDPADTAPIMINTGTLKPVRKDALNKNEFQAFSNMHEASLQQPSGSATKYAMTELADKPFTDTITDINDTGQEDKLNEIKKDKRIIVSGAKSEDHPALLSKDQEPYSFTSPTSKKNGYVETKKLNNTEPNDIDVHGCRTEVCDNEAVTPNEKKFSISEQKLDVNISSNHTDTSNNSEKQEQNYDEVSNLFQNSNESCDGDKWFVNKKSLQKLNHSKSNITDHNRNSPTTKAKTPTCGTPREDVGTQEAKVLELKNICMSTNDCCKSVMASTRFIEDQTITNTQSKSMSQKNSLNLGSSLENHHDDQISTICEVLNAEKICATNEVELENKASINPMTNFDTIMNNKNFRTANSLRSKENDCHHGKDSVVPTDSEHKNKFQPKDGDFLIKNFAQQPDANGQKNRSETSSHLSNILHAPHNQSNSIFHNSAENSNDTKISYEPDLATTTPKNDCKPKDKTPHTLVTPPSNSTTIQNKGVATGKGQQCKGDGPGNSNIAIMKGHINILKQKKQEVNSDVACTGEHLVQNKRARKNHQVRSDTMSDENSGSPVDFGEVKNMMKKLGCNSSNKALDSHLDLTLNSNDMDPKKKITGNFSVDNSITVPYEVSNNMPRSFLAASLRSESFDDLLTRFLTDHRDASDLHEKSNTSILNMEVELSRSHTIALRYLSEMIDLKHEMDDLEDMANEMICELDGRL